MATTAVPSSQNAATVRRRRAERRTSTGAPSACGKSTARGRWVRVRVRRASGERAAFGQDRQDGLAVLLQFGRAHAGEFGQLLQRFGPGLGDGGQGGVGEHHERRDVRRRAPPPCAIAGARRTSVPRSWAGTGCSGPPCARRRWRACCRRPGTTPGRPPSGAARRPCPGRGAGHRVGAQPVQEARGLPVGAAAGGPGRGPGQEQVFPGAGDARRKAAGVPRPPLPGCPRTRSASSPSLSPTRNTASHSRPLAACSEARVTPWTVGACWASGAFLELVDEVRRGANCAPRLITSSSARATSAASDSQRSRRAPPLCGAASV